MAVINPQKIAGNWHSGYALDKHTTGSVYLGLNEYGHDTWDNIYTELGKLLHRLKYDGDQKAAPEIILTAVEFLKPRRGAFDIVVPVPPSKSRLIQPVILLANGIGAAIDAPVVSCITPTRATEELKSIDDPEKRAEAVKGLYAIAAPEIAGKRILLFDDLYRSGTTMNAITDILLQQGRAAKVYTLAITCTRRNR